MRKISTGQRVIPIGLVFFLVGAGSQDLSLVETARNNDSERLRSLVEQGADVNAAWGDGTTALHWVSYWDDVESSDLLIRAGADANATTDLGVTPLWPASLNGSPAMVRRLLRAGANPERLAPPWRDAGYDGCALRQSRGGRGVACGGR